MKVKYQYIMTIECDEDKLPAKYPNWGVNYSNTAEFAEGFCTATEEEDMEMFGFRVTYQPYTPPKKNRGWRQ